MPHLELQTFLNNLDDIKLIISNHEEVKYFLDAQQNEIIRKLAKHLEKHTRIERNGWSYYLEQNYIVSAKGTEYRYVRIP